MKIYCKIREGETGPEFCCQSGEVSTISIKPTPAIREMFEKLGISLTRNWSGYEFFGFNKPEVLSVIACPKADYFDPENTVNDGSKTKRKRVDANNYPALERVAAIEARNAGKTSELLHNKSRVNRNAAIHDVVKMASSDDVKSEY